MSAGRANLYFQRTKIYGTLPLGEKTSPEPRDILSLVVFAGLALVLLMYLSPYRAAILSGIVTLKPLYPEILSWTIPFLSAMHCPV